MDKIIEEFKNNNFRCGESDWVWNCPSNLETIYKEGKRYLKQDIRNGDFYLYEVNEGHNNLNTLVPIYFD